MMRMEAVAALGAEVGALTSVLLGLSEAEAQRETRCPPWDVAALAAHTVRALHQVEVALDGPEPERAEVSAAGYYSPDVRFLPEVDEARVRGVLEAASRRADAGEAGRECERAWRGLGPRLAAELVRRVVRTRHGDAMLLRDYLVTRVVELALHGLDLADALERKPWTTPEGLAVVERLLFGDADQDALARIGVSGLEAVRAVTGRAGPGGPDGDALRSAGGAVPGTGVRPGGDGAAGWHVIVGRAP